MDEDGPTASMIIFVVLLLLNVIFFGFGVALNDLNEKEVERRAEEEKDKRSLKLMKLISNPTEYENTMQLITSLIYVILGAVHLGVLLGSVSDVLRLATENGLKDLHVSAEVIAVIAAVLSTALLLYITLTLGVLLPKYVAARIPDKWAYFFVTPVCFMMKLLKPFTGLVTLTTGAILRLFGVNMKGGEADVTEEEIISMVNEGQEQGVIEASEAEMISNIFELGEKEAQNIMTHRMNIVAIDCEMTLEEAVSFILQENYSRFPVYEETIDHVIGILHLKDALRFRAQGDNGHRTLKSLEGLLREPAYIPQTKDVDELFREMQAEKIQMVIVVDEYGQTDGLVALEDILEEIVGNIQDEYDDDSEYIEEKSEDEFIIEGKTPLEELEERFGISFADEEFETMNGFLISRMDRIPEPGEEFDVDYKGYNFKILHVENKMIQSVLVTRLPEGAEENVLSEEN